MKEIALPASEEARRKKCAALRRTGTFYAVCTVALAVLAMLLLLGTFITIIVFEFKTGGEDALFFALIGSFAGGAVVMAFAAFGVNWLSRLHRENELDFRERCDGEESFFVGDGTLATFGENGILIHGETGGKESVSVPYSEMRFFSVCTRRLPREKGIWSVVFEIPARYLAKGGRVKENEPPALVQTDAKDRLDRTLARHNLTLLGEKREGGEKTYPILEKFYLPNREKRKGALILLCAGLVLTVGGALLGVFWQPIAGAMLGAVGVLFAGRALLQYVRAKGMLGICAEGIYWRDGNRVDSVFLKWEEIERIECITASGGMPVFRVRCAYGAYHIPAVAGSEERLRALHPEKWGEEPCAS